MQSTDIYNEIINDRLSKLDLNPNEFIEALINSNGVIAGSFPLQCILGETYENSDIDIFIQHKNNTGNPRIFSPIEQMIYQSYLVPSVDSNLYKFGTIFSSSKYIIKTDSYTIIFNMIIVTIDPIEFVKTRFDLSFCQTYFDGKLTYYYNQTLQKIGTIVNPLTTSDYKFVKDFFGPQLVCRGADRKTLLLSRENRILKYKSRNFTIISKEEFIEYEENFKFKFAD